MDVKINAEEGKFKYRVSGAVIKDGKLLVVKIAQNQFYCLPGGHIHLGESSLEAIHREIKEEVGITCKSTKLISITENFFNVEKRYMHEVNYFYVVEPNEDIETKDYEIIENDNGEMVPLKFKWVELAKLHTIDFRPEKLITKFESQNFELEHIIFDQRK